VQVYRLPIYVLHADFNLPLSLGKLISCLLSTDFLQRDFLPSSTEDLTLLFRMLSKALRSQLHENLNRPLLSQSRSDKKSSRMVWYRGRWHRERLFPRKLAYTVLACSILCVLLGFAIWSFGPQGHRIEYSCDRGGRYYSEYSTALCGKQINVCVTFDYNCSNDYSPTRVMRFYPIYGLEAGLLALVGSLGAIAGALLYAWSY
jgi:hypothetical protein